MPTSASMTATSTSFCRGPADPSITESPMALTGPVTTGAAAPAFFASRLLLLGRGLWRGVLAVLDLGCWCVLGGGFLRRGGLGCGVDLLRREVGRGGWRLRL